MLLLPLNSKKSQQVIQLAKMPLGSALLLMGTLWLFLQRGLITRVAMELFTSTLIWCQWMPRKLLGITG